MPKEPSKGTYSSLQLAESLRSAGLTIRSFALQTEGPYTAKDAIWNYKDAIAHLPHLHPQVLNIPVSVESNRLISIFLQRLWFLRFPITVVDQLTDAYTQTTFTNCFFFSLIVENKCEDLKPLYCRVVTTYTLGIPKFLSWTFPFLKFILSRNYTKLMSTDLPCRERRGVLRQLGYTFKSDEQTFVEAENIYLNNVITPASPSVASLQFPSSLQEGESVLLGNTEGFRLIRNGDSVLFFNRICPHEGAPLEDAKLCKGKELSCPWHGRAIRPFRIMPYAEYVGTYSKSFIPQPQS